MESCSEAPEGHSKSIWWRKRTILHNSIGRTTSAGHKEPTTDQQAFPALGNCSSRYMVPAQSKPWIPPVEVGLVVDLGIRMLLCSRKLCLSTGCGLPQPDDDSEFGHQGQCTTTTCSATTSNVTTPFLPTTTKGNLRLPRQCTSRHTHSNTRPSCQHYCILCCNPFTETLPSP